jgi:hypothetical protein
MAQTTAKLPKLFLDVCVIYPSQHDKGMWVAHSINTDQLGVGDCVLDAYVELRRAVTALLAAAQDDPSIQVFRRAPQEVCDRLLTAKELPKEIQEIADMQMTGSFSATLDRPWHPSDKCLTASVPVYA